MTPAEPLDLIRKVTRMEVPGENPWIDYVPVTESEVTSACTSEGLIAELVKRGVLELEEDDYYAPATHIDGPMRVARVVSEWKHKSSWGVARDD